MKQQHSKKNNRTHFANYLTVPFGQACHGPPPRFGIAKGSKTTFLLLKSSPYAPQKEHNGNTIRKNIRKK